MKKIYFLRHGFSDANRKSLVNGTHSDPLTEMGRAQVVSATEMISKYKLTFTHCFVSQWLRAQETAAIFYKENKYVVDARLGETEPGIACTMTVDELKLKFPEFARPFDPSRPYPGGESHNELYARSIDWLSDVDKNLPDDASILAVTHAGPITCILQYVCGVSIWNLPVFFPCNASLSLISKKREDKWTLDFFSLFSPNMPMNNPG